MTITLHRLTPATTRVLDSIAEDVFDEPVRPHRITAYVATEGHLMVLALE